MSESKFSSKHVFMLSALLLGACNSGMEGKPSAEVKDVDTQTAVANTEPSASAGEVRSLSVDPEASNIGFRGAKVTGHHDGGFKSFTGSAELDGDAPRRVAFEVQMASTFADNEKLTRHLKSDEFFDVEKFETSTFESSKITPRAEGEYTHVIEGTLDLHGERKVISFPAKITVGQQAVRGTSEFTINRKDFGIEYPGMPDDLIKNEVLLKIDLVFPTA